MFGWFPTPYPDELLPSTCARYADQLHYPSRSVTVSELFGERCAVVAYDIPGHLNYFLQQLPPGHPYSLHRLLYEHTLFPFYVSAQLSTDAQRLEQRTGQGSSNVTYKSVGMVTYRARRPAQLRFCPACALADSEVYGEPYWHRAHQLPGVVVCPEHHLFLLSTRVEMQGRRLVRAKQAIEVMSQTTIRVAHNQSILVALARDAMRLLNENKVKLNVSSLRWRYRRELDTMGLMRNDRLLAQEAVKTFMGTYSSDILTFLPFNAYPDQIGSWIKGMLAREIKHPLDHLLMMHFLEIPL